MCQNQEGGGGGGAHGHRRYDDFSKPLTEDEYKKDVEGNNALIKELTEHLEDKDDSDKSDDEDSD